MRLKKSLLKAVALMTVLTSIFSCEDDFQNVGEGLVGNSNFNSSVDSIDVRAYTKRFFDTLGVSSNGVTSGALGYYQDPLYGNTTASMLSQVILSVSNPSFGDNVVVDSVVLSLPYYSEGVVDEEGNTEYTLDSVYGSNPIKLTGYRSNYFLSPNVPDNVEDAANYFSNQLQDLNGIEGDVLFEVPEFVPSNEEIVTIEDPEVDTGEDEVTLTRSEPALRLKLDTEYWKENIIDVEDSGVLFNSNTFKEYFRGLYIKAEPINSTGNYFLFDLSDSSITIHYRSGDDPDDLTNGTAQLNFYQVNQNTGLPTNINVIGYQNDFNPSIAAAINEEVDPELGAENLYLKGGQGSMAVIDLFGEDLDGNGVPEQLEDLREEPRLIREANLEFFVNQDEIAALAGSSFAEPERIYIYDLETNQPLIDYSIDATVGSEGALSSKVDHLGRLERDENDNGVKYTVKITEYIKALLNEDNEDPSTQLGLVVTQNVNVTSTGAIQDTDNDDIPNRVPLNSVLSQESTVLHGSASSDAQKKLQLKIYYTESTSN